jgi:putative ABC transport system permease protein
MIRDIRSFLRRLRRDWIHCGMAILILGVAVGATAAAYVLIDSLVLHPLEIPTLNRVVKIVGLASGNLPTADPVLWWKQAPSLEYLALDRGGVVAAQAREWRGQVSADEVSSEYFHVFAVKLFRGRDFGHEDELPAENHVVILSHSFWKSHFEDQALPLGSTLQLNRIPYMIVGIAPESLDGLATDLWIPRCLDPTQDLDLSSRTNARFYLGWVGRLRNGATTVQAHEELMDLLNHVNKFYGNSHSKLKAGEFVEVFSFQHYFVSLYGSGLKALLAGAVLILLIASADCSGFLIGRAARSAKEVAIRRILGASQLAIFRQSLIEASGLGLLSGFVGVLVAKAMLFACQSVFPVYLVRLRDRELIGPRVFLGCLVVGIVVGILAGWLPGKRMASEGIAQVLKEDSGPLTGPRGKWLRVSLVSAQIAFTFVLLMGAALMLETADKLLGNGKGYTLDGVFAAHLSIPGEQITRNADLTSNQNKSRNETRTQEKDEKQENLESTSNSTSLAASAAEAQALRAKETEILETVASAPGVSSVSLTDNLPVRNASVGSYLNGWAQNNFFSLRGVVDRNYFRVLRMRFLAGHTFSSSQAQEIIIEERVRQALWPGQNAVGRTVRVLGGNKEETRVVVGVVNDTRSLEIGDHSTGQFYLPGSFQGNSQRGWSAYLLLFCPSGCAKVTPTLLAALQKVGADSYVDRVAPLADYSDVTEQLWIRTSLLSFFALMGLALALGGVFVLSSYLSVARKSEIGVRLALGAERAELVLQIAREGIVSGLIGLSVGGILWLNAVPILKNLIYGVTSLDPITFGLVGSLLFAVTASASTFPVFLAVMRQNPADLLRVT